MENINQVVSEIFNEIAEGLETGSFGKKIRIGVTTFDNEHGAKNILKGAEMAQQRNNQIEVVALGHQLQTSLKTVEVSSADEAHKKMEALLERGELDACVTCHYNFPIGVSTVGKVITPGKGQEMFLATTTGTTSANRIDGMILNGINGIIAAKASGIQNPTIGILNVDGARQVERALNQLKENGYEINFVESQRADGGCIMRGNDLLMGTPDVMITDSLTGNIMMKVFSAYMTGGDYEALGYGYGPGIGKDYDKTILILSRASGAPVVENAINYAYDIAKHQLQKISASEYQLAEHAKLREIIDNINKAKTKPVEAQVKAPEKEVVTATISGIDIMELEEAVQSLWAEGIYAESGMGCTGPILMVNEKNLENATRILVKKEFVAIAKENCC